MGILNNSLIKNSLFTIDDEDLLPISWGETLLTRNEDSSAGYYYTINISPTTSNLRDG
jgi:hypothetical protein